LSGRSTRIDAPGVPVYHFRTPAKDGAGEEGAAARQGSSVGFCFYLLFMVSWFLHLPARIPALGAIRFDLLLVVVIFAVAFLGGVGENPAGGERNSIDFILKVLCVYIVVSIPFQTWPGSALFNGLPNFIKAVVFYFFTVWFVTSERRLKAFIAVFVACQCFRVFEPVYLHITSGYWGDKASLDIYGTAFMSRLSGAPKDIVNPNGLAFVIDMAVSLLFFLGFTSRTWAAAASISIPICLYALVLTGSRGGMIGLLVIMASIFIKIRYRKTIALLFVLIVIIGIGKMGANDKDRYLSIIDSDTKNAYTADDRIKQITTYWPIVLEKPIFGHGIGTSLETNSNLAGRYQPAHDLYIEVGEELGLTGMLIFILFMGYVMLVSNKNVKKLQHTIRSESYLHSIADAIQICVTLSAVFSFASYGLSLNTWYMFGGCSMVVSELVKSNSY
jgi:putative inorganic carbon (HCO3(-)) transporter